MFSSNLAVLVNGCPTQEICIQRGLKQGNPLAPFLFLLVAKGQNSLIFRAVELHLLFGIRVGSSGLVVSHLQYVDYMIILDDTTIDNLWTIKTIHCGFELTSGLRVKFSKSSSIRVNSDQTFLDLTYEFLYYKKDSLPFKYLGLPVGSNPRLAAMWEHLVNLLSRMLLSWKHMYVSLGGRVILLNYILNSIPIFFLYFLKMFVKV